MATQTSTGVEKKEEMLEPKNSSEQYRPDEEQKEALAFYLERLKIARDKRESPHREFDDMSYLMDYQANLDAANTRIQPRRNREEVQVNTATTEKKIEAVHNELLAMNIKHEVTAHDKFDRELQALGKDFEHMVTRTNDLEREEMMWSDCIRELLTQRAVFVEEKFIEKQVTDPKNRNKKMTIRRAEKHLVPGYKIYLGDINLPSYRFNDQPYYLKYDKLPYLTAQLFYGDNENWKFVTPGGKGTNATTPVNDLESLYQFRMHDQEDHEVEIVQYYSFPDNEYNVIINGVLMYEPGTPLEHGHEGYRMTMTVLKPIRADFAYGKPLTASSKMLQALENETLRNLIRKFRQSLEPPFVTTHNKKLSRDIFNPAAITTGIRKEEIQPLLDNLGVSNSEFAMYKEIADQTESFIGVSDIQQGLSGSDRKTATETLEQLRQSIKMLGLAVLALIRLREDVTMLRIYNILENYTKPVGKKLNQKTGTLMNEYMQFTIPTTDIDDGLQGKKVINFSDRDLSEAELMQLKEFEDSQARRGTPIRIKNLNIKTLRQFPVFFKVSAFQKEREGSALNKLMFREQLGQAIEIEAASQGEVRVNYQNQAEKHEAVWGTRGTFKKTSPQVAQAEMQIGVQTDPQVAAQAEEALAQIEQFKQQQSAVVGQNQQGRNPRKGNQTGIGAQLTEAPRSQTRQPSLERLIGQTA